MGMPLGCGGAVTRIVAAARALPERVSPLSDTRRRPYALAAAFYTLLAVWALRTVLFTPGVVGRNWDWSIPNYPDQFLVRFLSYSSAWVEYAVAGAVNYFRPELYYWLLLLPFSPMGGELVSKLVPLLLLVLSGLAVFRLARASLELSSGWALLAGVLYMLSPVAYSRLVAGHLSILMGYALLPLAVKQAFDILTARRRGWRSLAPPTVMGGLLIGLSGVHPSMLVLSAAAFVVILGLGLLRYPRRGVTGALLGAGLVAFLVNAYWLVPLVTAYVDRPGDATPSASFGSLAVGREQQLQLTSQPIVKVMRLDSEQGVPFEYVYPVPEPLEGAWVAASVLMPILALLAAIRSPRPGQKTVALLCMGVLGVTLATGVRSVLGSVAYLGLLQPILPPIFAEFWNPNRALPLIVLAYSSLVPLGAYRLVQSLPRVSGRRAVAGVTIGSSIVFVSPFLAGDISRPLQGGSETFSLNVNPLHPEEREVHNFFRASSGDYRLAYLPSGALYWPGSRELSYMWTAGFAPRPEVFNWPFTPALSPILGELQSTPASPQWGEAMALFSVRYILFAEYPEFVNRLQLDQDFREVIERNLELQEGLEELEMELTTARIFENQRVLPLIYVTREVRIVDGEPNALVPLLDAGLTGPMPAILLKGQGTILESVNDLSVLQQVATVPDPSPSGPELALPPALEAAILYTPAGSSLRAFARRISDSVGGSYMVSVRSAPAHGTNGGALPQRMLLRVDGRVVELLPQSELDQETGGVFAAIASWEPGSHGLEVHATEEGWVTQWLLLQRRSTETRPEPTVPSVDWERIRPTRYRLRVSGANGPAVIVLNTTFHSGWRAGFDGRASAGWYERSAVLTQLLGPNVGPPVEPHWEVNGYANGWLIDVQGDLNIVLDFAPQLAYEMVLLVSLSTCLVSLVGLGFLRLYRVSGVGQ